MEHFDIGVVGWWYGENYGSMLTYYALHQTLKSMGYSVLMIHDALGYPEGRIMWSDKIAPMKFAKDHYNYTEQVNYTELKQYNESCDIFICGSDQLWNPLIKRVNSDYFLDFTSDGKKRISYGTSFGNKSSMNNAYDFIENNIKNIRRFDAVSVREDYAVDIAKKYYGIKAVNVADPVFLIDISEYEALAEQAGEKTSGEYLLAFILDPTVEKKTIIHKIADKLGLKKIYVLCDPNRSGVQKAKDIFVGDKIFEIINELSPMSFLYAYKNASYVITDSFHGTCFSYIFHKDFNVFYNVLRGSDRFESLMKILCLENRRIFTDEHSWPDLSTVNFFQANKNIEELRKKSIEWLKNAIETPKENLPDIKLPEFQSEYNKRNEEFEKLKLAVNQLYTNPDYIKIRLLATLLHDYGVKHIVLSPGGRDVPLVRMFEQNEDKFIIHPVTDERSAAYFGLGIAAQLKQPVACVCTSGTAASNYLPAVTEAYYTGVPLIVITADRKEIYLNHGEDQTIPQRHIYDGVIKKSVTLPEGSGYMAEYQARRDISDCILEATHNGFGPVHINIAIDNISIGANIQKEHWNLLPYIYPHILRVSPSDGDHEMMKWVSALIKSQRILVVYGQNPPPTDEQKKYIEAFASKFNCVIVTDFISNLDCAYSLKPYNMLNAISQQEFNEQLSPDILITVGGKRLMNEPLTYKIRGGLKNIRHWSVTPNGRVKDFYFRLSSVIEASQNYFFQWFSNHAGDIRNNGVYYDKWKKLTEQHNAPEIKNFNAVYVHSQFIPAIPENSILHLGVGMSFFDTRRFILNKNVEVFCNMGTNGIDGCTSTFMGQCSVVKDKLCFLLVGDLSFFYDMNSIWNKTLNNNIRILMVNNNGTDLLRGHRLKYITSIHNTSAKGWVESVGFEYICAHNKEEFDEKLKYFLSREPQKAVFFEVLYNY